MLMPQGPSTGLSAYSSSPDRLPKVCGKLARTNAVDKCPPFGLETLVVLLDGLLDPALPFGTHDLPFVRIDSFDCVSNLCPQRQGHSVDAQPNDLFWLQI